jgi:hypothetical protein
MTWINEKKRTSQDTLSTLIRSGGRGRSARSVFTTGDLASVLSLQENQKVDPNPGWSRLGIRG